MNIEELILETLLQVDMETQRFEGLDAWLVGRVAEGFA